MTIAIQHIFDRQHRVTGETRHDTQTCSPGDPVHGCRCIKHVAAEMARRHGLVQLRELISLLQGLWMLPQLQLPKTSKLQAVQLLIVELLALEQLTRLLMRPIVLLRCS